ATGVMGLRGRGSFEHHNLSASDIDIHMTSGSKALGASGGFIAGCADLIDLIRNRSAAYIYTTSLSPDSCASTRAALDLVDAKPDLRTRLWENTRIVRAGLLDLGFDLANSQTQIIPVMVGEDDKTVAISNDLYERGIYLYGIRPPTVPAGQSRLRLSVMATHSPEDIRLLLHAMSDIQKTYF
ncbi:MAG: aminotransferase class I/II-fold pyridoxal phosphate-dependent enzyme, partial [bacterium]|nr:aminotransferase class I/II-fold pyridoxal phosphate-dependent enzyme [bacterium]